MAEMFINVVGNRNGGYRELLFNSFEFILFFIVVTGIYFCLPRNLKCYWLLMASYFFYMCWNAKYALLMLFATASSYLCARLMYKSKKKILLCGIFLNMFLLVWYKYANFLIDNLNILREKMLGNIRSIDYIDVVLPVGISFYVFQVIGYMVDVYRGQEAEKNFFKYALFVSFYPQLVAGPIERSANILGAFREIESGK